MDKKKKKDLSWVLSNGNFPSLLRHGGTNISVVDTGVVIDFENIYHNNNHSEGYSPHKLLMSMENYGPIILPDGVNRELMRHRSVRIGNRFEISSVTSELLHNLYLESREHLVDLGILESSDDELKTSDYHRYAVRSAAEQSFKGDSRKNDKDHISDTDVETLTLALDISQSQYAGEDVHMVNVFSPDYHVLGTLHELKNGDGFCETFKNYHIRGVNTRGKIGSYMEK